MTEDTAIRIRKAWAYNLCLMSEVGEVAFDGLFDCMSTFFEFIYLGTSRRSGGIKIPGVVELSEDDVNMLESVKSLVSIMAPDDDLRFPKWLFKEYVEQRARQIKAKCMDDYNLPLSLRNHFQLIEDIIGTAFSVYETLLSKSDNQTSLSIIL